MGPEASINKASGNTDYYAHHVDNIVTHIALQLKVSCMSSIIPPKTLDPINTGSKPKRPVL